jgi:hypothetical protein
MSGESSEAKEGLLMRTLILAIGLIALAMPALACSFNQTTQSQQTPMPVASSDQPPPVPQPATQSKPQS